MRVCDDYIWKPLEVADSVGDSDKEKDSLLVSDFERAEAWLNINDCVPRWELGSDIIG